MKVFVFLFLSAVTIQLTGADAFAADTLKARLKLTKAKSVKGNMLCVGPSKVKSVSLSSRKAKKTTFSFKGKTVLEKQSDCRFTYKIL